jgi:DNA-binding PadR family transcriptional regulator
MARLLLVLATALALLAGCGGGDDGDSGGGDGPSREEFVAAANEICTDGEEKIQEITSQGQQELQQASSDKQRRDAVGDLLEQTADEYRPYLDRLDDLEPPEDIAEEWSNFVDGITEAFDLIPELADATRENDEEKLSELTREFSGIAEDTRPFAERAGLDDCLPDESA